MSATLQDLESLLMDAQADEDIGLSDDQANEDSGVLPETEQAEPMDENEIQGVVQQFLSDAAGGGSVTEEGAAGNLSLALDYYFGRPRGDEIAGRSEQQSLDVADMIESVLAETTPIFSNDTNVSFGALDEQDEDQAQEESRVVNHVIMQSNTGYVLLYTTIKDALLQKNGIVHVYVDEKLSVGNEQFKDLNPMEMMQALQPADDDEEIVLVSQEPSESDPNLMDIEIKRVRARTKLVVDPVPPEDFKYYAGWDKLDLEGCPFTARRRVVSRSDLILAGYDKDVVDRLPPYTSKDDEVSVSRNQSNVSETSRYTSAHKATDPIEIWYCCAQIDEDGDGVAELRWLVVAGANAEEVLEDIPCNYVPFASGTSYLMPHRFLGLSLFDKLWDVQDGKTTTLRQWDDNLNTMNNRRLAVDYSGMEDPDSLLESKPGGVVSCNRPPADVIMPVPADDIGPSCQLNLEYYDRIAARRAGATLDIQSRGQNMPGGVGSLGLDRLMTAEEQMAAMMARSFGETLIRNMYKLVHYALRTDFQGELKAKISGSWVNSNPSQWKPRDDLEVTVGLSGTERVRKMGVLGQVLGQQLGLMQQGGDGVLVDDTKVHNTLTDFAQLGNLSHPERYWIDPQSQEAQQRKQQNAMMAQQQSQAQMQQMQAQMQMQQQVAQAELGKAQAQMMKVRVQAQLDSMKQKLDRLQSLEGDAQNAEELAFKYAQLIDQHSKWLTELEVQTGVELNAQAQQNAMTQTNAG